MIRILIGLPLLAAALGLGALYYAYGQIDPCRTLAVERARRAEAQIGVKLGGMAEGFTRMQTSQMSSGECVRGLVRSWRERFDARE